MLTSRNNRLFWVVIVALSMSSNLVAAQGFDVALLTDCWEWVIGFSTESCTATCAQVGRTCDQVKIGELNSVQALSDAISTSFLLGSATGPGSMASFCNGGINIWPFATAPAAFAYQTFVPNADNPNEGVYVISHYCYFPTDPAQYLGDCDTEYALVPSQRICSCYNGACPPTFAPTTPPAAAPTFIPTVVPTVVPTTAVLPPQCDEWILGYSTESCTATCNRIGATCNATNLETIVTQQAFYDMVTVARTIDASCPTGNDADVFCTKGVNTYSYAFAPVPAAFAYKTHRASGRATETFCNYPVSVSNLTANCDAEYVYPPSRRFCSCTSDCPPPTAAPSMAPTDAPTVAPSVHPSAAPSADPTFVPSNSPTMVPSASPSATPTFAPSAAPSTDPTASPSAGPSADPSVAPTAGPTVDPSATPTFVPSASPSATPTFVPSAAPSANPTYSPTTDPSVMPSAAPSVGPTADPSVAPSVAPSASPSAIPTFVPSAAPSAQPSAGPTVDPTVSPTFLPPTQAPTLAPSSDPSVNPSASPSASPSQIPTASPTGCFKFVVGYSEKSCTETCADPEVGAGGVCENSIINSIDTAQDFSSMLTSAILLGSGGNSPGSVATFCTGGVNTFLFANSPAAFAYQQYKPLPAPHYVVSNYCYYRPAAQGPSTDTCDTKYIVPPSQRMCSCRVASCVDSGAFPVPSYGRRLEGEAEEQGQIEGQETALVVTTSVNPDLVVEEKVTEVLTTTAAASVASISVLQGLLNQVPLSYQIPGAAAVLLALLCALALYNTLTTTKNTPDTPAYCSSPTKGVTWASSLEHAERSDSGKVLPQASRNRAKREVYIEMPEM